MMIMTFLEVIGIFLYRNVLYETKITKNLIKITLMAAILMLFHKSILTYVPNLKLIFITIINIIFIKLITGKELMSSVLEILVGTLLLIFSEIVSIGVASALFSDIGEGFIYVGICSTIIICIVTILVLIKLKEKNKLDFLKSLDSKKISLNILLNCMLVILFFKTLFDEELLYGKLGVELSLYVLLFIMLSAALYKSVAKVFTEKRKLEVENNFKPILNEYIDKLRASEHEYKNHLNAIYSTIQVSDEKDMKENVEKYISNIKRNDYLNNLLHIDNTILKAVLYSKMSLAEEKGIGFKYEIWSSLNSIKVDDMDLVIILSNLLNNAIEASENIEDPQIKVKITEEEVNGESIYKINVTNKVENVEKISINEMINTGHSTKGDSRGYGLYNVKNIIKRIGGKMLIDSYKDTISISIII